MTSPRTQQLLALAASALLLAASPDSSAQAKPALVRDVSTAQPVNGSCNETAFNTPGFAKCVLYTVPVGKRLVVESVSYKITLDPTLQVTQLLFGFDNLCCTNILFGPQVRAVNPMPAFSPTTRSYMGSENIRLYLEENGSFSAIAYFQTGGPAYSQYFNFTGYLVDK